MIPNWILPRHGGGWLRRYLAFRKDVYRKSWETKDIYPCLPVPLFDYTRPHDAADAARVQQKDQDSWRVSDDRVIGGFSESRAYFFGTRRDYQIHMGQIADAAAPPEEDEMNQEDLEPKEDSFIPFLRWQGTLDTTVGLQSPAQRSGFAALRSPEFAFSGADLQGMYNALEVTCRPDDRVYTINLKVASSIPDDLYQKHISRSAVTKLNADAGEFDRFVVSFSSFRLTSRGRDREFFRELDTNVSIESIGFTIMDGQEGDFSFDLCRIRAVNLHHEYGLFESIPGQEVASR